MLAADISNIVNRSGFEIAIVRADFCVRAVSRPSSVIGSSIATGKNKRRHSGHKQILHTSLLFVRPRAKLQYPKSAAVQMATDDCEPPLFYSYRRASMGSSLAAFNAGKNPNTMPMMALTVKARRTDVLEISVGKPANLVSNGASQ